MALKFLTSKPQDLLNKFNQAIEQKEVKGKITTWIRSNDKKYYTHKAEEWNSEAWFKPSIHDGALIFNIIKPQNKNITSIAYAYYHGHLTETFLNHFDNDFSESISSAMPTSNDNVS
ncbi:hypothetical protein [Pantoea endophytica]|uniref:hypothetical protein n=1 Tax=Pantoea endophytica TaxID=92488 RepID=UPI002413732C|nr:hypothetical protein [Pantoea endophytica]